MSEEGFNEKEIPEYMKDGLELKYIFRAISEFIKDVSTNLKDLIDTMLAPVSGERLGEEIGSFYENLKQSGVPEDLANEMTRRYFEARIAVLEIMKSLPSLLQRAPQAFKQEQKNAIEKLKELQRIKEKAEKAKEKEE